MHENSLLLDLELLILFNKSKSTVNISLINILMHDYSNFNSNYIDNDLLSEADSTNKQELKELTILLKTRV